MITLSVAGLLIGIALGIALVVGPEDQQGLGDMSLYDEILLHHQRKLNGCSMRISTVMGFYAFHREVDEIGTVIYFFCLS